MNKDKVQKVTGAAVIIVMLALIGAFVIRVVEHVNYLNDGSQRERDLCWVADGEWKGHGCYHKPNPFPQGDAWYCLKRSDMEDIICVDQKTSREYKVNKQAAQDYLDWKQNKG